jgi:hypothetical protein
MAGPFELQLQAFTKKAGDNADVAVRKVVLDVGARLVMRSPVDTGRFRSNWFYSEAAPSSKATLGVGSPEMQDAGALTKDAAGKVHYVMNNLPYAWRLENGYSKQAPAGMVGLTVVEFQGIVSKAAGEARSGNVSEVGA